MKEEESEYPCKHGSFVHRMVPRLPDDQGIEKGQHVITKRRKCIDCGLVLTEPPEIVTQRR